MEKKTLIHIKIPYWFGKFIHIEISKMDERRGEAELVDLPAWGSGFRPRFS